MSLSKPMMTENDGYSFVSKWGYVNDPAFKPENHGKTNEILKRDFPISIAAEAKKKGFNLLPDPIIPDSLRMLQTQPNYTFMSFINEDGTKTIHLGVKAKVDINRGDDRTHLIMIIYAPSHADPADAKCLTAQHVQDDYVYAIRKIFETVRFLFENYNTLTDREFEYFRYMNSVRNKDHVRYVIGRYLTEPLVEVGSLHIPRCMALIRHDINDRAAKKARIEPPAEPEPSASP